MTGCADGAAAEVMEASGQFGFGIFHVARPPGPVRLPCSLWAVQEEWTVVGRAARVPGIL